MKLDRSFAEGRDGKISNGELSHRVHQYEASSSRELYKKYNYSPHDVNVAYAIASGLLKQDEIACILSNAERGRKEEGEFKDPGE
jgi:hypothetical protein